MYDRRSEKESEYVSTYPTRECPSYQRYVNNFLSRKIHDSVPENKRQDYDAKDAMDIVEEIRKIVTKKSIEQSQPNPSSLNSNYFKECSPRVSRPLPIPRSYNYLNIRGQPTQDYRPFSSSPQNSPDSSKIASICSNRSFASSSSPSYLDSPIKTRQNQRSFPPTNYFDYLDLRDTSVKARRSFPPSSVSSSDFEDTHEQNRRSFLRNYSFDKLDIEGGNTRVSNNYLPSRLPNYSDIENNTNQRIRTFPPLSSSYPNFEDKVVQNCRFCLSNGEEDIEHSMKVNIIIFLIYKTY